MTIIRDPENKETTALLTIVDLNDRNVLEVGCGDGRYTFRYADRAAQVTGIDPIGEAIEIALANLTERLKERVAFLCSSFEDFARSSPKHRFDLAIFSWSL